MWNNYSVSIYDQKDNDWEKIEDYVCLAHKYGCKEIFTSAHMPENEIRNQLEFVSRLGDLAHRYGMILTVDFGGKSLHHLLNHVEQYKDLMIDYVRMDYGYEASMMVEMERKLNIKGFVWNASIIDEDSLKEFLEVARNHKDYKIRACHNFYPRKETALDREFVLSQNEKFRSFGITVTTCVPNLLETRPPLHEGLPTIEDHRNISFEETVLDCMNTGIADEILIGDLWLNEEQFKFLWDVLNRKILEVKVRLADSISEKEKKIVLEKVHRIRYDSNHLVLRSQSSREMAEYATEIEPNNQVERVRGAITIDNKAYGRYSGELQIIQTNLEPDSRVNVVAYVCEQDMFKFNYYRYGFSYVLREIDNE